MTALTVPARDKLLKILPLLGSDKAGERDAAGLAAVRLLRRAGLDWADVIPAPTTVTQSTRSEVPWREVAKACAFRQGMLRPWEVGFVHSILQQRSLSPKQRGCLYGIAERLGVLESAA